MFLTMLWSAVLAEELQEDAVVVSEAAQVNPEGADFDTEINADTVENASDSETNEDINKTIDIAIEEVPEINDSFPAAETDETIAYEDEIVTEESGSLASEEIIGAGDDYPANLKNAAIDAFVDPWNFYNRLSRTR